MVARKPACSYLLVSLLGALLSNASGQPLGTPAVNPADRIAIGSVQAALFTEPDGGIEYGWIPNTDPCGIATCAPCAWTGIACRYGRIVALDFVGIRGPLLQGTLPAAIGQLSALEWLEIPNNRIGGTLPPEIGQLPLRRLNLAYNTLTGTLPPAWRNLTRLSSLDLSFNKLTGTYPTEWVSLSISPNISGNPLCANSTTLTSNATVICTSSPAPGVAGTQQFGANTSAPPSPPPWNGAPGTNFNTFGSFQMSTGINIAVSVVIASALLIALAAGYLRIRRQQQAHRAYLETRTRVLQVADADPWPSSTSRSAPPGGGEPADGGGGAGAEAMPFLVLAPDGKEISIAKKESAEGPLPGKENSNAAAGDMNGEPGSHEQGSVQASGLQPAGANQDNGRELTSSWLRRWGAVDRVWAEHVAASLNAELDARRRTRRRPLPLYIATLQRRANDPSAMDFMVHADEPAAEPAASPAAAPAPPPPRFAWLGRIGRMRRGDRQQNAGSHNTGPPANQPHQVAVNVSAQQPHMPLPQHQQHQQQSTTPTDANAMV